MRPTTMISLRLRSFRYLLRDWTSDCRGVAATEFAFIVPLMLVMFFGTVEFCSGIAVDRKVTLMARTLSDLTSQSTGVTDTDLANFFLVANNIIWPYQAATPSPYFTSPESATVTELYVDPTTHKARVQWSIGTAPRTPKTIVSTIPAALLVDDTYLIFSEVSYVYKPTVGYVMKASVTLSDVAYTRPRQSKCTNYSASSTPATTCTAI